MASRHFVLLALFAGLLLTGCESTPPLTPEEMPGDFRLVYEMKVTDEEVFRKVFEAEAKKPTGPEGGESEEAAGLPRTLVFVEIAYPGRVKYEVHFGFGNPVKRTGEFELTEEAMEKVYRLVRNADVAQLKQRYVGSLATGKEETYLVRGNLQLQVIDVKGARVPVLERLWSSARAILLDKDSRIFDDPDKLSEIFIVDKRNREFHRSNCERVKDVPEDSRLRKDTLKECLDSQCWPCETCKPIDDQ